MSDRDQLQRLEAVFHAAIERSPEEREAYVELVCASDPDLRDRVMRLVRADEQDEIRFDPPSVSLARLDPESGIACDDDLAGQRVGAYRLLRRIGEGGMGSVWLGERDDQEFERRVAVKVIKRGMDTEQVLRRFRVERRALGVLEHPNIARLIDAAMAPDGRPALVMEYVDGLPLASYCDSQSLSVNERLRLFVQVCDAVEYAHRRLVVHRDLKPSNIFVTAEGEPKLIDFGIAKLLSPDDPGGQTLTRTHQRVLTPRYASPEQIRGERVTTSTDVFSLGVVLYELLAGRPPFDSPTGSRDEIGRLICEEQPVRPSTAVTQPHEPERVSTTRQLPTESTRLKRELEGDLDTIVLMALRKEPDRRYGSVQQLSDDVRRYLEDRPVLARPDTLVYRTTKFIRRNRAAVVSGVAAMCLLLTAVVLLSWMFVRTKSAERSELAQRRTAEAKLVEADRVASFLEDMLKSATPDQGEGRDPGALREILNSAQRRLSNELAEHPRVRARIEHTLGASYRQIGDYPRAQEHLENALQLRRSLGASDEGAVAETVYERASLELDMANVSRARELVLEALQTFRAIDINPTKRLANAEDLLATTSLAAGAYAQAQLEFETATSLYERVMSPDAPELLSSYGKRAVALAQQGRTAEATELLRDVVQRFDQSGARVSSHTLSLQNNLAVLLRRQGELEPALEIYDQIVEDSRAHFGPNHRLALLPRSNRGALLHRMGRPDEAESELVDVLDAQRIALGAEHEDTLATAFNLAQLLSDLGRFADAEPIYELVVANSMSRYGGQHPQTAQLIASYARAMHKHDPARRGEAIVLMREQVVALERTLGEGHPSTVRAREATEALEAEPSGVEP